MILESWTLVQPDIEPQRQIDFSSICLFYCPKFCKRLRAFFISWKGADKMYFTNTPSLNSMEAIMKRPPGGIQRGGGRKRKPYQYTKADCSCRLCPHYQGKRGCAVSVCPVLNIRLECSAAPLEEAVQSTFSEVTHTPFKQRLQRIYKEKRGGEWLLYQNLSLIHIWRCRR